MKQPRQKWQKEVEARTEPWGHHHHLFWKRPFLPRYARVRRLPIWSPPTHPWIPPIQDVNQTLSCHYPHTLSKSSYSSSYISPLPPPPFFSSWSAPGPSISEGMIREKRLLYLLTTAGELTSCRHPTSPQRASTFPEETQNSLYATVHVTPLRIDVNSVNSTTTTTQSSFLRSRCTHHLNLPHHNRQCWEVWAKILQECSPWYYFCECQPLQFLREYSPTHFFFVHANLTSASDSNNCS